MPVWTPETERRLLLAIICIQSASPPKWDDVVPLMGSGYTAEGIRQKYQKIRKSAADELSAPATGGGIPAKPAPRKRKVGGKGDGNAENGGDEDGEVDTKRKATPRKKVMSAKAVALSREDDREDENIKKPDIKKEET